MKESHTLLSENYNALMTSEELYIYYKSKLNELVQLTQASKFEYEEKFKALYLKTQSKLLNLKEQIYENTLSSSEYFDKQNTVLSTHEFNLERLYQEVIYDYNSKLEQSKFDVKVQVDHRTNELMEYVDKHVYSIDDSKDLGLHIKNTQIHFEDLIDQSQNHTELDLTFQQAMTALDNYKISADLVYRYQQTLKNGEEEHLKFLETIENYQFLLEDKENVIRESQRLTQDFIKDLSQLKDVYKYSFNMEAYTHKERTLMSQYLDSRTIFNKNVKALNTSRELEIKKEYIESVYSVYLDVLNTIEASLDVTLFDLLEVNYKNTIKQIEEALSIEDIDFVIEEFDKKADYIRNLYRLEREQTYLLEHISKTYHKTLLDLDSLYNLSLIQVDSFKSQSHTIYEASLIDIQSIVDAYTEEKSLDLVLENMMHQKELLENMLSSVIDEAVLLDSKNLNDYRALKIKEFYLKQEEIVLLIQNFNNPIQQESYENELQKLVDKTIYKMNETLNTKIILEVFKQGIKEIDDFKIHVILYSDYDNILEKMKDEVKSINHDITLLYDLSDEQKDVFIKENDDLFNLFNVQLLENIEDYPALSLQQIEGKNKVLYDNYKESVSDVLNKAITLNEENLMTLKIVLKEDINLLLEQYKADLEQTDLESELSSQELELLSNLSEDLLKQVSEASSSEHFDLLYNQSTLVLAYMNERLLVLDFIKDVLKDLEQEFTLTNEHLNNGVDLNSQQRKMLLDNNLAVFNNYKDRIKNNEKRALRLVDKIHNYAFIKYDSQTKDFESLDEFFYESNLMIKEAKNSFEEVKKEAEIMIMDNVKYHFILKVTQLEDDYECVKDFILTFDKLKSYQKDVYLKELRAILVSTVLAMEKQTTIERLDFLYDEATREFQEVVKRSSSQTLDITYPKESQTYENKPLTVARVSTGRSSQPVLVYVLVLVLNLVLSLLLYKTKNELL